MSASQPTPKSSSGPVVAAAASASFPQAADESITAVSAAAGAQQQQSASGTVPQNELEPSMSAGTDCQVDNSSPFSSPPGLREQKQELPDLAIKSSSTLPFGKVRTFERGLSEPEPVASTKEEEEDIDKLPEIRKTRKAATLPTDTVEASSSSSDPKRTRSGSGRAARPSTSTSQPASSASRPSSNSRRGSFTPIGERVRSASISLAEANPRLGVWSATGELLARGELADHSRRGSVISGKPMTGRDEKGRGRESSSDGGKEEKAGVVIDGIGKRAKTKRGLLAFWRFATTPMGAFITIYMLLVIIFGAWLFFLLLNALPAYSRPPLGPDHPDSPRRIWVEITSQVMNALFCVTAFGLAPWRFRDAYLLLRWRWAGNEEAGRRIREINGGWYVPTASDAEKDAKSREERLKAYNAAHDANSSSSSSSSSTTTSSRSSSPTSKPSKLTKPPPPLPSTPPPSTLPPKTALTTSPPTKPWKLHFVIWMYILNTLLQIVLCYFMWGYDRFERPAAAVGALVAGGCGVAGAAGGLVWWEGRRVKRCIDKVEGGDEERGRGDRKEKEGEQAAS